MALQMVVGVPISSISLRKRPALSGRPGGTKTAGAAQGRRIDIRILPPTPELLDIPLHPPGRLAVVGVLAMLVTQLTGLSTGVTFLVGGILFGAIGFVEKGALRRAGGEGLLMLATYASITTSFVSMTFSQFGKMLCPCSASCSSAPWA